MKKKITKENVKSGILHFKASISMRIEWASLLICYTSKKYLLHALMSHYFYG